MMVLAIGAAIAAWSAAGAAGSYLAMEFMWRRGDPGLDVDVGDFLFFATMAIILGPFNLVIGLCFALGFLIKRIAKKHGYSGDRVLLGRKP